MKTLLRRLAIPALLAPLALGTGATPSGAMSLSLSDDHVRWSGHRDPADARFAITTEDGKVTLLLTDHVVAVQLSERMVHKVRRELRDKREDQEDNALGMAIASAVIGTVEHLIDDSFVCCVSDLRDVSYDHGRLRFTARNGESVFEDADVCDTDVMASFSERDARSFVREFRRLKGRD